ncbi:MULTISPECIES: hypothetical protein [Actinosynnema]|uniref:hypothetical protein n=1 Tax=Actinosynnema TaxID=40566 RepID=UPI0020A602D7|nr:hypothetical protein [Actinosynnema pretiosum]MCP2099284.1 hypothetical protein [Actinosynnema pretiosum]
MRARGLPLTPLLVGLVVVPASLTGLGFAFADEEITGALPFAPPRDPAQRTTTHPLAAPPAPRSGPFPQSAPHGVGTPDLGTAGAGTPGVGTPGSGTTGAGTPGTGTPGTGTHGVGTPDAGTTGAGTGTTGAGTVALDHTGPVAQARREVERVLAEHSVTGVEFQPGGVEHAGRGGSVLGLLGDVLGRSGGLAVTLVAHTWPGEAPEGQSSVLALRRAEVVRAALVDRGVPVGAIRTRVVADRAHEVPGGGPQVDVLVG